MKSLSKYIEHTNISLTAKQKEIRKLCQEAKKYNFRSVVTFPEWCHYVKEQLKETNIKAVQIYLFPNQLSSNRSLWADEIDVFVDFRYCDSWRKQFVIKRQLQLLQAVCGDKPTKIVIETNLLTDKEIYIASRLVKKYKFDYIKSSTGLFDRVRLPIVELKLIQKALILPVISWTNKNWRPFNKINVNTPNLKLSKILFKLQQLTLRLPYLRIINPKIKISGGIRDQKTTIQLIKQGANLIGTSHSVEIMETKNEEK